MTRYIFICVFFILSLSGVLFAESIDITPDLQQNIKQQPQLPANSAVNAQPPSGNRTSGENETMKDIFDIKSLEKIGFDKRIIKYAIIALVSILLVGLLIYLIDYFIRKKKRGKIEEIVVIPADLEANRLLEDLARAVTIDAREYYFRLTAIIRGYIGRRFEIDAPEMTSEELIPRINKMSCEKNLKMNLKSFLKSTDPVKFAGTAVLKEKMDDDFQFAKEFIKKTSENFLSE